MLNFKSRHPVGFVRRHPIGFKNAVAKAIILLTSTGYILRVEPAGLVWAAEIPGFVHDSSQTRELAVTPNRVIVHVGSSDPETPNFYAFDILTGALAASEYIQFPHPDETDHNDEATRVYITGSATGHVFAMAFITHVDGEDTLMRGSIVKLDEDLAVVTERIEPLVVAENDSVGSSGWIPQQPRMLTDFTGKPWGRFVTIFESGESDWLFGNLNPATLEPGGIDWVIPSATSPTVTISRDWSVPLVDGAGSMRGFWWNREDSSEVGASFLRDRLATNAMTTVVPGFADTFQRIRHIASLNIHDRLVGASITDNSSGQGPFIFEAHADVAGTIDDIWFQSTVLSSLVSPFHTDNDVWGTLTDQAGCMYVIGAMGSPRSLFVHFTWQSWSSSAGTAWVGADYGTTVLDARIPGIAGQGWMNL